MFRGRRLVLVGLDWVRPKDPPVSLANATIAAACSAVTDTSVVTLNCNEASRPELMRRLEDELLDATSGQVETPVVGIGAYVWAQPLLNDAVSVVKRVLGRDAHVVLGGPQVSYAPATPWLLAAEYPQVDAFVRGGGERAMRALFTQSSPPDGYLGREDFDMGLKASGSLEDLPSPFLTGWLPAQSFLRWETSRGCPFKCSFCQHKDVANRRIAVGSERVQQEARWMVEQSERGVLRDLAVVDPTFNAGSAYLDTLSHLSGLRAKLFLQCRLEMMTPAFSDAVARLRDTADVTLEFGVQTIHKGEQRHIDRPNNARKVRHWLDRLNKDGTPYELSFIYGLPAQTLDSFKRTHEWATSVCDAHASGRAVAKFFPLMLLRGTKLHDNREDLGLVTSDQVQLTERVGSGIPHVVASRSFSVEDWVAMHTLASVSERIFDGI